MSVSKVYFCDMRTLAGGLNLPQKLVNLMKKGGFENIDLKDKFVAIKMHFGEDGNLAFLRPQFPRAIADLVKSLGGKPFLCDCNTMYTGGRHNGLDHLATAEINGFNSVTAGCHVVSFSKPNIVALLHPSNFKPSTVCPRPSNVPEKPYLSASCQLADKPHALALAQLQNAG